MTVARVAFFNEQDQCWQSASGFMDEVVVNNPRHAASLATALEDRFGFQFRAEVQKPGTRNEWVPLVSDTTVAQMATKGRELVKS